MERRGSSELWLRFEKEEKSSIFIIKKLFWKLDKTDSMGRWLSSMLRSADFSSIKEAVEVSVFLHVVHISDHSLYYKFLLREAEKESNYGAEESFL